MQPTIGITVTQHIINEQITYNKVSNALIHIFNRLILSAKIINYKINKAGLSNILGTTNKINIQGEEILKLDKFADDTIIYYMKNSKYLCAMISEEHTEPIEIFSNIKKKGEYILIFDPLDGSSNIDANITIGTIFSILHKQSIGTKCEKKDLLQPGYKQIAAGYFLYGPSTMMVYTTGNNVNGFTLDPTLGEFILTHKNIQIPTSGKIFSANIGNLEYWDKNIRDYIHYLCSPNTNNDKKTTYSCRYTGSLVADFHRTLLYGGIFLYPANNQNSKKYSKLRLLYECNPLALIVEKAGGLASTGKESVMEIIPLEIHQRIPLIIGSTKEVNLAKSFYNNHIY